MASRRPALALLVAAMLACVAAGPAGTSAVPTGDYADAVRASGPVSYWRLGEASGLLAVDTMGTNSAGYAGGVALGQPGAVDGDSAVRLNGSSGHVRVPDSASLDTGDDFAVELWVKLGRRGVSQGLVSKGGYLIFLDAGSLVNLRKPNVGNIARSTLAIPNTSSFHHVVVAKAGPAVRIYIDGVDRTGAVSNRTVTDSNAALLLGAGSGYLDGTLDEVAIYDRALTAPEVAEHYAARAPAAPRTLYVDTASTGGACSDAQAGTDVSLPLCTLPRAAELIADGGTILVREGTYPKLTVARTHASRTSIEPYPGEQPTLEGVQFPAAARNIRLEGFRITDISQVDGQHVELVDNEMSPHGVGLGGSNNLAEGNYIHDLRIVFDEDSNGTRCHGFWRLDGGNDQNGDGEYDIPLSRTGGIAPWCGHAFRTRGANHVIRGNVVRKVPADGVQAFDTTNLLVEGNRFEDVAIQSSEDGGDPLEHPDGAQVIGRNEHATFRRNAFIDNRGILPMLGRDDRWPSDLRVENNVFHTVTKASGGAICIQVTAVTRMTFVNNTCWGDGDFNPAVRIHDGTATTADVSETTGVVLRNNIFERYVTGPGVDVDEDHNLIRSYEAAPGQGPGSHTGIGLPTFVEGDPFLRLAAGSAGIDAGTSDGAPDRDRESALRCDDPSVANTGGGDEPYFDIGAHEFRPAEDSCVTPPPPPPPPPSAYADVVVGDGPVSFWRLGESSGVAASDGVGPNAGGYLGSFGLGEPGAVAGDTAVRLNGSNGHVRVPDSASLDTGDDFSVELWLKLGRLGVGQGLVSKGGYLIHLDGGNFVNLRKPNVGNIARSSAAISDTSEFHHLVVAKAGAAVRIYIDGVDTTGAVTNHTVTDTSAPLLLGAGAGYLNGTLDEVAVYDRALTEPEAAEHHAAR